MLSFLDVVREGIKIMGQMRDWLGTFCAGLVAASALCGCGADAAGEGGEGSVARESEALVITNCTGAAISAAITAGGNIVLNCGAAPVTIPMPFTPVSNSVQLTAAVPGSVTFSHPSVLFEIGSAATFSISGISFDGSLVTSAMAFNTISSGVTLTISNATFAHYHNGFVMRAGGGASLTVSNATFDHNTASGFAAAIYGEGANVTVNNSRFFRNMATGSGGAITLVGGGTLNVSRSTFAFNRAGLGGAIYANQGPTTIDNSTFYGNTASSSGGAVYTINPARISNSTFSSNPSPTGTIFNAQVVSSIIYDAQASQSPCTITGTSNIQWPAVTPLCGAGFRFADPKLASLSNNGGFTETIALLRGSAAIDSSTAACVPGSVDQRGSFRPRDGDRNGSALCDVGAYEAVF